MFVTPMIDTVHIPKDLMLHLFTYLNNTIICYRIVNLLRKSGYIWSIGLGLISAWGDVHILHRPQEVLGDQWCQPLDLVG